MKLMLTEIFSSLRCLKKKYFHIVNTRENAIEQNSLQRKYFKYNGDSLVHFAAEVGAEDELGFLF
jgi:hypothetical protein